jgi:hypothetical protein
MVTMCRPRLRTAFVKGVSELAKKHRKGNREFKKPKKVKSPKQKENSLSELLGKSRQSDAAKPR